MNAQYIRHICSEITGSNFTTKYLIFPLVLMMLASENSSRASKLLKYWKTNLKEGWGGGGVECLRKV